VRSPFHLSYLIYLQSFSPVLSPAYRNLPFTPCKIAPASPSFLLHPLDFLDRDEAPELAFFPGMKMSAAEKMKLAEKTFAALEECFTLVSMRDHARS